ncbi:hypothetical protein DICVIV_00260 [Dictyocaulus viviparus]|uniref:Uncharacterized protein n=1 Tax=Dictyocaulus viviparus TaxID=29172 RepID=A0A0D8YBD3_DICVI|nr:hypothetical protein DICVIV_00260 [Dictyocaulus viviparus]
MGFPVNRTIWKLIRSKKTSFSFTVQELLSVELPYVVSDEVLILHEAQITIHYNKMKTALRKFLSGVLNWCQNTSSTKYQYQERRSLKSSLDDINVDRIDDVERNNNNDVDSVPFYESHS